MPWTNISTSGLLCWLGVLLLILLLSTPNKHSSNSFPTWPTPRRWLLSVPVLLAHWLPCTALREDMMCISTSCGVVSRRVFPIFICWRIPPDSHHSHNSHIAMVRPPGPFHRPSQLYKVHQPGPVREGHQRDETLGGPGAAGTCLCHDDSHEGTHDSHQGCRRGD